MDYAGLEREDNVRIIFNLFLQIYEVRGIFDTNNAQNFQEELYGRCVLWEAQTFQQCGGIPNLKYHLEIEERVNSLQTELKLASEERYQILSPVKSQSQESFIFERSLSPKKSFCTESESAATWESISVDSQEQVLEMSTEDPYEDSILDLLLEAN